MIGPGIRPGRMVLLTSGIVDERLGPLWSPLSTAGTLFVQGGGVEPAAVPSSSRPDTLLGSQRSGS
jgi:hypothetical protein